MAIEDDVTVVGGGIAGMTAALAAAREGVDVRLLSHKDSTLKSASGLVDVLGYLPESDGEGPLSDPFEAIPQLPDAHPYRTVGVEGVREALAVFDGVVGDRYRGDHTDRNALVPTHGGAVKPTARYPASAAAGLASDDRSALLVGFETVTDFDAPLAADHLESAGVPFAARGATISFPGDFRVDAKITRFADALDADERVAVQGDGYTTELPVREALAEAVKPHLRGAERVGFPALLGQHRPDEVRESLEAELGAAVFEVPMGPPSIPGMRLEGALTGACREAGVRFTTGNPVVDYEEGGRAGSEDIAAVRVERNGAAIPFHADQFVLATGGLVGKGIDSDREGVAEPIFDCHVPHSGDRYDWFADAAFGDHPFARFGVETDDDLRPLDRRGDVEFPNLRAAGAVLGGHDFAAEKSGAGVSLATGVAAGRSAAKEVSDS
ncbi:glycerol-3-phosphate dehydrogenase subunit GlpB [Halorussus limi]|uniref:Glycerol-3-phosphate dehydrogenase subunit GlpB n=1 Tax=Halorussus limi TaxID=2938695 RepID=A0A8U0HTN8_9EURY|nr:glycerol-3-phosphate dehydrogenase subunit GlpB [Halorussus limi]UPV74278.1 glycerol-3-phosphate dehydrogenase subunit GlpB [Halorussus limi]